MTDKELKELLDSLHDLYNNSSFIENDPISVPHQFSDRNDIEISGFMAATIAWGNRKMIVRNANKLVNIMGSEPYRFTTEASDKEIAELSNFVHRTFNGQDAIFFIKSLRNIYLNHGGIGNFFENEYSKTGSIEQVLSSFRKLFFSIEHNQNTQRHLSSIDKGSACKRLNMYIKWMVRKDDRGVDLGLWEKIPSSVLYLPLDVHSANISRQLGLLKRRQNDWKAVDEVTKELRRFDVNDPVKYDFALFGAGVNKYF